MNRHPLALLLAGVLLLAGCGSAQPPERDFTVVDVMFLQMTLSLHAQGLELTGLARQRAVNPAVRDLADELDTVQRKESETMTAWLTERSQPTTMNADPGAHAHHGGLHQTSPAEVEALKSTPDGDFDATFLNLMTGHLHNSVELAKTELEGGGNEEAKEMAARVRESRTAEISRLLALVG
jgi:uncharacterized protein (DUF305 family)